MRVRVQGSRGHEASDVADWLKYVPGFEDDAKTPAMLTHPITAISDDGSAVTPEILDQVLENVKPPTCT